MIDWPTLSRARDPRIRWGETPERVALMASGLVYLATPYTRMVLRDGAWHFALSVEMQVRAERHAARLAALGVTAVSPIALAAGMCHASHALDPLDAAFWARWCAPILAAARAVVVPDVPGWHLSDGIRHEVSEALARNLPVHVYAAGAL